MLPLQGLSDEHWLLVADNEVAPGARAKEALGGIYMEATVRFVMSVTAGELKVRFLTVLLYTGAAVVADVLSATGDCRLWADGE